jgi:hypothetical protein
MADYVPPMPKKGPAVSDPSTPSDFPRATAEEKAKFAQGFGGKERKEPAAKKAAAPRRTASVKLEEKLEELFSALALPFMLAGDKHCADIIAQGAPKMASAWVTLADENPGVKRVLNKLTEGSAWGGVILSTAAVAVPIAAHHGAPLGPLGSVFGGSSSPAKRAPQRPSQTTTNDASAMGAPAPTKDPVPRGASEDGYVPAPVAPGEPAGVVTVGHRNMANASGANGAAAY